MDPTIRAKLDRHIISAYAIMYRAIPGGLFEIMPHWARGYSGLQNPIFNIFLPLDWRGLSDETLADTSAFFSSRNVHYAVELVHDLLPKGPGYLTQRRYQSLPPQPAMFLAGAPDDVPLNSTTFIERIMTVPSLTAFCSIMHAVFDFPLRDMSKLFPVPYLKENRIGLYLAFWEDQPVGAGMSVLAEGVVTLRNVCTLDEYRGRGIATTLAHRMLSDARANGCDLATLYSTPQSYTLYNKLGFEIYTQRQWFLPPGIDYED
jgi:GNAT superfamily N-acetyltransferase